eukprot:CAMPEP_0180413220 /NCGR_PEP_ID=MMETSP0989-20121125/44957_1 /TAXON_ID=697907 /ORGANISM="non described non described, Strain CCMP2293" /LENGTH=81 /DNA_ID=CAMNT_0022417737 /DNA_START=142 /DNA_END=387 /DNA_ORIENTATION=+
MSCFLTSVFSFATLRIALTCSSRVRSASNLEHDAVGQARALARHVLEVISLFLDILSSLQLHYQCLHLLAAQSQLGILRLQ